MASHSRSAARQLRVGLLKVDTANRIASYAGSPLDLYRAEYRLLEYFVRNVDRVVTRTELLQKVWHPEFLTHTGVAESHISRLRATLREAGAPKMLQTIRSRGNPGYRFTNGAVEPRKEPD
jgi:DNA-binding response OmpR family regulator